MSFMNAKEARPVEDPKALVPFGWAPGGYHCAACATCGEAHSGSDKRSMRCQDCAEALRDRQAEEPAPTPRETADHAERSPSIVTGAESDVPSGVSLDHEELAADLLRVDHEESEWPLVLFCERLVHVDNVLKYAADGLTDQASEIAALRGERDRAKERMHTAIDKARDEEIAAQSAELRTTQAERQRDELRKALERVAYTKNGEDGLSLTECVNIARQALANQGADQ